MQTKQILPIYGIAYPSLGIVTTKPQPMSLHLTWLNELRFCWWQVDMNAGILYITLSTRESPLQAME